jgi:hypothetical protein
MVEHLELTHQTLESECQNVATRLREYKAAYEAGGHAS